MRRIVIIGPAYPFRGGIAHFSAALARTFRKSGMDSSIVTFTTQYPDILFPGTTQYEKGPPPKDLDIHRWLHSVNPFSWIRTIKKIRALNPDYVVVQFWIPFMAPCLGTVSRQIRKGSRIRVIAIVHNVTPHEGGFLDRQLSRYFFRSCNGFITLSSSVLEDVSFYAPDVPARTTSHPLYSFFGERVARDKAVDYLKLDSGKHYLLFFGLVRRYKGLDLLLRAMASPVIRKRNICLIVAGEFYEKKEPYIHMIRELGIQENVILTDRYIPDEEVKYYFSLADLVVQPYRSATQSGVTQIAYQFNRPVLVSNVGGLPELVAHMETGYITGLSESEIAEAIHDFFENQRAEAFEKNIQNFRKRFEWDRFVGEMEDLYASLNGAGQE